MTPQKIRLTGCTTLAIMLLCTTLSPLRSVEQTCGGTVQTVSYDTTLYGGGSQSYTLPLPQYYSAMGYTLISANLTAYLTTTVDVQFQNTNVTTQNFNPNITRGDEVDFNGDYLTNGSPAPFNFAHATIAAGATKVYPTQTVFNNYKIIDYLIDASDPMLNAFQGMDTLKLNYSSSSYVNTVPPGVIASSTASDNIVFSVTYTFCNPVILASDFLSFTAKRQDMQSVALNWEVGKETDNRRYDIEVSSDGKSFAYYKSVPSDPLGDNFHYVYGYYIPPGAQGNLYFRLKMVGSNGTGTYSPVRVIDLDADLGSRAFMIYPNPPTDYINVAFPSAATGWQVEIFSSDGGLVQRNFYNNTAIGRVSFTRKLSAGAYFVRATNTKTAESRTASFIIRR